MYKNNKHIVPKKINFKLIYISLFIILSIMVYFLVSHSLGVKSPTDRINSPQIITIDGRSINLAQLIMETNKGIDSLNQCLIVCNQNLNSQNICLAVNDLNKNKADLSLLRNYYNSGLYRFELTSQQKQSLEKIKNNMIEINNKMQLIEFTCKQIDYSASNQIPSEIMFEMPEFNFHIGENKIPTRSWLKENKDLFSIATCNSIMEIKAWKKRLKKRKINLDLCIYHIMPTLFDKCIKVNSHMLPSAIDKINVIFTRDMIIGCLVGSFAQDNGFIPRK
ncbi:hypothetical protein [Legionella sp. PC997]|uniref:hypothetical protein n=1 Tax=Legionella sp. PC997 TaxID=2755562 RepID=UPI0015FAA657|nr:hypothetical protein [Legionella sp. PC997]QMT62141.1 hypothetical protein HBNCFIEN_03549 [Legionella sp. PC997]